MTSERNVFVFSNNEEAAGFAVNKWMEIAAASLTEKDYFTVALSGGKTPVDLYKRLCVYKDTFSWEKTHIFLADERFVPAYDKDNNFGLIKQHLLNYIEIPDENLHTISTEDITLEQSAKKYEEDIRRFFHLGVDQFPDLDLIMLGIGEDGHTASLFPGTPPLGVTRRLAVPVTTDRVPHQRISLTLPLLINAKQIIFLVGGVNKARILKEILENGKGTLPAALVHRRSKTAYFVIDQGAASLLSDRGRTNNEIL